MAASEQETSLELDVEPYRNPSREILSTIIERAGFYAEQFRDIQCLIEAAESQYRAIAANEEYKHVDKDNVEKYERDKSMAKKSLVSFEDRLDDVMDSITDHSRSEDPENRSLEALHEGITTYAGVHLVTVSENCYMPYEEDLEIDTLSDLRAFSAGGLTRNPTDNPLQGIIMDFSYTEAESDSISLLLDEDNIYGALKRFIDGDSLLDIFHDTGIAEQERERILVEHEAGEHGLPSEFVYKRRKIDEIYNTDHWNREHPVYLN